MNTPTGALPPEVDRASLAFFNASGGGGGTCVDVAFVPGGGVAVRHSRNPDGALIYYTDAEWQTFLTGAKSGHFDQPQG
ncbi:MAG: DUF397 domain-containing protein [Pseudonocardiaceae bacterium]|nr:DUF397 domain-containing protein [Pseudonocardiaceae bacterium]